MPDVLGHLHSGEPGDTKLTTMKDFETRQRIAEGVRRKEEADRALEEKRRRGVTVDTLHYVVRRLANQGPTRYYLDAHGNFSFGEKATHCAVEVLQQTSEFPKRLDTELQEMGFVRVTGEKPGRDGNITHTAWCNQINGLYLYRWEALRDYTDTLAPLPTAVETPATEPEPLSPDVRATLQLLSENIKALSLSEPSYLERLTRLLGHYYTVRKDLSEAAREINCRGSLAERIRVLKTHHGEQIGRLEGEIEMLRAFARDIAMSYDHDANAHQHNNLAACRVCEAERVLKDTSVEAYRARHGLA